MTPIVAVSQRVIQNLSYPERRDALDQRWTELLGSLGFVPVPIPNRLENVAAWFEAVEPQAVVLTGGNTLAGLSREDEEAPERDQTEMLVANLSQQQELPILGVCRGCQLLAQKYGATIELTDNHVAVRHNLQQEGEEFPAIVNSFHRYQVSPENFPVLLRAVAWSDDGSVEAFRDSSERVLGIMWHPEREMPFHERDLALILRHFHKACS